MIDYFKIAISDFKNVASPFATSKFTARSIVSQIKPQYKFIVEYGAGNGSITKELLKRLPEDGKLLVIEINKDFVENLKEIKDKRLIVINADVRELSNRLNSFDLPRIDVVISGIPFSFFKKIIREEIIVNTFNSLTKGGEFIVYQVTPALFPIIKKIFKKKIKLKIEFRNFIPYFIMIAEK